MALPPWTKTAGARTAGLGVVGALILLWSWLIDDTSWLSGLLINIGASIVIFAPLLVVGAGIERRLGGVEVTQEKISDQQDVTAARIEEVDRRVNEVAVAGDELRQEVMRRITSSRDSDWELFGNIKDAPTSEGIRSALDRAETLGLIPRRGCRAELRETDVYLRFSVLRDRYTDDAEALHLAIEDRSGTTIEEMEWPTELSTTDALARVSKMLSRRGRYPGDRAFDPIEPLENIHELVTLAYRKSTGAGGFTSNLGRIYQLCKPQWAISDTAIVCIDGHPYSILLRRLDEPDWYQHMMGKTWVDRSSFTEALDTATALYENRPPDLSPHPFGETPF